jgi:hypothetical protein
MAEMIDEALTRLAMKAATLRDATEAANELIQKANQQLAAMNLGMEVWLGEPFGMAEISGMTLPAFLGFTKTGDCWQLAVRVFPGGSKVDVPLVRQSRDLRVRAAPHVQGLIQAITSQVDDLLQAAQPPTPGAKP